MPYEKLTARDTEIIWDKVRKLIDIQLFYFKKDNSEISGPKSSIIFSIKDRINKEDIHQLKNIFAKAFKLIASRGEMMYALDWRHESYCFSPHEDWSDLPIKFLTDGDYFIFLNKQMTEGTFGHPWQNSICFFGPRLCSFIEKNTPMLFSGIIRKNL